MDCEPTNPFRAVCARFRGALRRALRGGAVVSKRMERLIQAIAEGGVVGCAETLRDFADEIIAEARAQPWQVEQDRVASIANAVERVVLLKLKAEHAARAPATSPMPVWQDISGNKRDLVSPRAGDAEALLGKWADWYDSPPSDVLAPLEETRAHLAASRAAELVEPYGQRFYTAPAAREPRPVDLSDCLPIPERIKQGERALDIVQRLAALPGYIFGAHVQLDSIIRDARALAEEEVRNE